MKKSNKNTKEVSTKPLTKGQLLEKIAEKMECKKSEAKVWVDELVSLAQNEAKKCGTFNFPGLGKLIMKQRKARMGRNPKTGEQIKIKAKKTLKFRVSKACKVAILGDNKK